MVLSAVLFLLSLLRQHYRYRLVLVFYDRTFFAARVEFACLPLVHYFAAWHWGCSTRYANNDARESSLSRILSVFSGLRHRNAARFSRGEIIRHASLKFGRAFCEMGERFKFAARSFILGHLHGIATVLDGGATVEPFALVAVTVQPIEDPESPTTMVYSLSSMPIFVDPRFHWYE
jgi:hypothetical protein